MDFKAPINDLNIEEAAPAPKRGRSRKIFSGIFGRNKSIKTPKQEEKSEVIDEADESMEASVIVAPEVSSLDDQILVDQDLPSLAKKNKSTVSLQPRASKAGLRSKASREPATKTAPWVPPPLFQAYPQAVKHSRLQAPTIPADDILRLNRDRNYMAVGRETVQDLSDPASLDEESAKRKSDAHKKLKRHVAEVVTDKDWTQKIFVLTTSEHMLQYAGDGTFDRLPEKVLSLGKDSAAFASDALPGKHWVLQINHASVEGTTVNIETSRSIFKRLGFRSDIQRNASSFLLVLDSPEDMDAWLVAVRKEIEAMGGKKYRPDVGARKPTDETVKQHLQHRPSARYLVARNPKQFTEMPETDPAEETHIGEAFDHLSEQGSTPKASDIAENRQSTTTRDSMDSPCISNATFSTDQAQLNHLRESSRFSYVSVGAKTSTSRASSLEPSPSRPNFDFTDLEASAIGADQGLMLTAKQTRVSTTNLTANAGLGNSPSTFSTAPGPRVMSVYGSSPKWTVSPAPNFSVPMFSKRYSAASNASSLTTPPASSSGMGSLDSSATSPLSDEADDTIQQKSFLIEDATAEESRLKTPRPKSTVLGGTSSSPAASARSVSSVSSKADQSVPRRFSSLEYSKGIAPVQALNTTSPSPHPPPKRALPPLPETGLVTISRHSTYQPNLNSNKQHQPRRPISMQVRSELPPHVASPLIHEAPQGGAEGDVSANEQSPPRPNRAPPLPPSQEGKLQNRKSMPQTLYQSNPPEVPLPELPSQHQEPPGPEPAAGPQAPADDSGMLLWLRSDKLFEGSESFLDTS